MTPPDRAALERVMATVHDSNGVPGTVGETNALRNCREMLAALEAAGVVLMPAQATDEMCRAAWPLPLNKNAPGTIYAAMVAVSPFRSKP